MATYWKSQPKHHCEYCDCWITDNKPSKDYHENGKKHQENVAKKINELKKKGDKDAKQAQAFESSMEKMEKAAIAALKKDLAQNPELASQYGVTLKNKESLKQEPPDKQRSIAVRKIPLPKKDVSLVTHETSKTPPVTNEDNQPINANDNTKSEHKECLWKEAKSEEGYVYYWHTLTSEVTWTKPEGYISEEESKQALKREADKQAEPQSKHQKLQSETEEEEPLIESAPEEVESKDNPPKYAPLQGPLAKPQIYGDWETVKREAKPSIDLQLPKVEKQAAPVLPLQETKISFREKVAPAFSKPRLFDKSNAEFKKRKLKAALNIRQRTDD